MFSTIPLVAGSPEQFSGLRAAFQEIGFVEQTLAARCGLPRLALFTEAATANPGLRAAFHRNPDAVDLLLRLFLFGEAIPRALAAGGLLAELLRLCVALRLVGVTGDGYIATVMLYPISGLWIASDRFGTAEGLPAPASGEFVLMALQQKTESFLNRLPDRRCDSFLDLGCGCGVAALRASRHAREVWAVDISRRCADYTEFNRLLNGIENVVVRSGSLYDPLGGRTFDTIAIHPPYDISPHESKVFCDGGSDGEHVLRPVVEGLAQHLAPGGWFYWDALMSDHADRPFEWRVRDWLGDASFEFDVAVFAKRLVAPSEYAANAVTGAGGGPGDLAAFRRLFERLNVNQLVYGHLVLRRLDASRTPVTLRRPIVESNAWADLEAALEGEVPLSQPDFPERFLASSIKASSDFALRVTHRITGEELNPVEYLFAVEKPLPLELRGRGWMAYLVNLANGRRSGQELFAELQSKGVEPREFFEGAKALVSAGVLRLAWITDTK